MILTTHEWSVAVGAGKKVIEPLKKIAAMIRRCPDVTAMILRPRTGIFEKVILLTIAPSAAAKEECQKKVHADPEHPLLIKEIFRSEYITGSLTNEYEVIDSGE